MKKLLLILICLFVSFEVNAESDNLTGKKLLCEHSVEINGYEFTSNEEITNYKSWPSQSSISTYKGKYKANRKKIILNFPALMNVSMEINKQNLEVNLVGIIGDPLYVCKIFEGDLETYFQNLKQIN